MSVMRRGYDPALTLASALVGTFVVATGYRWVRR